MNLYRITYGDSAEVGEWADDAAAAAYANSKSGTFTLLKANFKQYENVSTEERLEIDKIFGAELFREFLEIQRQNNLGQGNPMSLANSKNVRDNFKYLKSFVRAGDIIQAGEELQTIPANALFPQELKDYFLSKINAHLAKF